MVWRCKNTKGKEIIKGFPTIGANLFTKMHANNDWIMFHLRLIRHCESKK